MLTTSRRFDPMKRSLATAAGGTAFLRATLRLPLASCRAASRPASITRESSRSSSAVRSGTLPMSFRYRPIESFIVMGYQPFVGGFFDSDPLLCRSTHTAHTHGLGLLVGSFGPAVVRGCLPAGSNVGDI